MPPAIFLWCLDAIYFGTRLLVKWLENKKAIMLSGIDFKNTYKSTNFKRIFKANLLTSSQENSLVFSSASWNADVVLVMLIASANSG